jgi:cohesin domain-containing protein
MKKLVLTLFLSLSFLTVTVRAVEAAPHLTVNPSSGSYSVDGNFDVTLGVDSSGETVGGVDGVGSYDSDRLELVSITQASNMVFANTDSGGSCAIDNSAATGKFSFSCYSNDALSDSTAVGDLVKITFKGKSEGTATLNYTCTSGSTTDSNIVKSSTVTDVIACASNQSGSWTIGSGGSTSSDPTSTPTIASTTELPQTGNLGVTLGIIAFASISLLSAVFLRFL